MEFIDLSTMFQVEYYYQGEWIKFKNHTSYDEAMADFRMLATSYEVRIVRNKPID